MKQKKQAKNKVVYVEGNKKGMGYFLPKINTPILYNPDLDDEDPYRVVERENIEAIIKRNQE